MIFELWNICKIAEWCFCYYVWALPLSISFISAYSLPSCFHNYLHWCFTFGKAPTACASAMHMPFHLKVVKFILLSCLFFTLYICAQSCNYLTFISLVAIHKQLSSCRYPSAHIAWPPSSINQGNIQESSCDLDSGIFFMGNLVQMRFWTILIDGAFDIESYWPMVCVK